MGRPRDALYEQQASLNYIVGSGWERYERFILSQFHTYDYLKVHDREGSMRRMRISAAAALRWGKTYWWSPDMCGALERLYTSVPDAPLTLDFPVTSCGFFYYDKPIKLGLSYIDGSDRFIQGTAWITFGADGGDTRFAWDSEDGTDGYCVIHFGSKTPHAPMIPITMSPWSLGATMQQHIDETVRIQGPDTEKALEEASFQGRDILAIFVAGQLLLRQKCSITESEPLDRVIRRQISREKTPINEPDIRVITLRRPQPPPTDAEANDGVKRSVEWRGRWWVGLDTLGFWSTRHTREGPKRILIEPFVKGPPGKPILQPKPTVRAVVR